MYKVIETLRAGYTDNENEVKKRNVYQVIRHKRKFRPRLNQADKYNINSLEFGKHCTWLDRFGQISDEIQVLVGSKAKIKIFSK